MIRCYALPLIEKLEKSKRSTTPSKRANKSAIEKFFAFHRQQAFNA